MDNLPGTQWSPEQGRCKSLSTGKQAHVDLFVNHPNCGPMKGGIKDLWTRI